MAVLTQDQQHALVAGMAQTTTECCCGGPCLPGGCCRLCPCVDGNRANAGTGAYYWIKDRTVSLRLRSADLASIFGYRYLLAIYSPSNPRVQLPSCWAGRVDNFDTGEVIGSGDPIDFAFSDLPLESASSPDEIGHGICKYLASRDFAFCGGILTIGMYIESGDIDNGFDQYSIHNRAMHIEWFAQYFDPLLVGSEPTEVFAPNTWGDSLYVFFNRTDMYFQEYNDFPNPDSGESQQALKCFACPLVLSGQNLTYSETNPDAAVTGIQFIQGGAPRVSYDFQLNCGKKTTQTDPYGNLTDSQGNLISDDNGG